MATTEGSGRFARAYGRGVLEELGPPPAVPRPRGTRPRRAAAEAAPAGGAGGAAFALRGAVLTPGAAWGDGYVVVEGARIAAVQQAPPQGVRVLETDGVILPGLLDLHGHPEFNVFAAWEPPTQFANRYRWRSSDVYHQLVRDPQDVLLDQVPPRTQLRYAEIRALVGGVTGIQGASAAGTSLATEPLVRNVDLFVFGQHKARSMIDLPTAGSRDAPRLAKIVQDVAAGAVTAFYLHLCEGRRGDQRSESEYARFLQLGAATPGTVIIHGTSLTADQIHEVADAGCKLVWSPQSNLRLYGQTTLAAEALRAGMPLALGADWLPSGSTSLLAELKVARRELAAQGLRIEAADLVDVVTAGAARIAGLDEHLGAIAPGRPADLVVLERHHEDPYENVCQADPDWVDLVLLGGDVTYGRTDWFATLTGAATGPTVEQLRAWGKPMTLDTGYQAAPDGRATPAPSLTELRRLLTTAFPRVGPIFA